MALGWVLSAYFFADPVNVRLFGIHDLNALVRAEKTIGNEFLLF